MPDLTQPLQLRISRVVLANRSELAATSNSVRPVGALSNIGAVSIEAIHSG